MSLYLELSRLRRRTEQHRAKDPATPAAAGEGRRACKGPQTSWKIFCVCKPAIEIGLNFESEPKLLLNSGVGVARGRKKILAGGRKVAKHVTGGGANLQSTSPERGSHLPRMSFLGSEPPDERILHGGESPRSEKVQDLSGHRRWLN